MKPTDRDLGMDRQITRRDLLQGVGAAAAASFVPGRVFADQMLLLEDAAVKVGYPPSLVGLRGSHIGSFEVAHQLAREGRRDWGPVQTPETDMYDLVVVGAGISGLAAAHFYRRSNPGARVLILDNHDDFGGHAKRNEFSIDGRTLLAYGGSQSMEDPSDYSKIVNGLLSDLGVSKKRFKTAYDSKFFERHGLAGGLYFDRKTWGSDRLVRYDLAAIGSYLPLASGLSADEAVQQMPLADAAKQELLRLLTTDSDQLSDIPWYDKEEYLYSISYRDFLSRHLGISEPQVFAMLQYLTSDSSVGIEMTSAAEAMGYSALPGRQATGLGKIGAGEPYIHHFPDGNASIARSLVRMMIPPVAPGSTMDDIVTAQFDYNKLDAEDSAVRIRLQSTVVNVEHDDSVRSAKSVAITYIKNGQACKVRACNTVLACYNGMIPSICPELPEAQRQALAQQVKAPILYTNVALNNWRAWKKLGIGAVAAPNSYHVNSMLDFPVSIGNYEYASGPDDPIVVHMERFAHRPNEGLSTREQRRLGRHEMYSTTFESIERSIREQLAGTLADGGFDPAVDIAGITVNRWGHGYADGCNFLEDPYYDDPDDERYPHVIGRKPFGRIAIANSDAGARAMLESAIEQAHRAVEELA